PGVNSKFFCPGDQPVERGRYVLSVGALWKFKGHETVVRILGHIPIHMRPELKIIADREYPGYSVKLHSLADSLSVKIAISRDISEMSLRKMYRKAQAVICCQRNEPYGLVPLESMACGTPVIAIQEGGFVDNITEGKTGFLFSGDPEEGAELLMNILKDSGAASIIGSNGVLFTRKERTIVQGASRLGEILESL
ncbi:MAG: glycosyltransferase, partial [Candidatus Sabulitectum sp.]|nr:glycosyltransferase [Candidatus Sabulitectum sp.]